MARALYNTYAFLDPALFRAHSLEKLLVSRAFTFYAERKAQARETLARVLATALAPVSPS